MGGAKAIAQASAQGGWGQSHRTGWVGPKPSRRARRAHSDYTQTAGCVYLESLSCPYRDPYTAGEAKGKPGLPLDMYESAADRASPAHLPLELAERRAQLPFEVAARVVHDCPDKARPEWEAYSFLYSSTVP